VEGCRLKKERDGAEEEDVKDASNDTKYKRNTVQDAQKGAKPKVPREGKKERCATACLLAKAY